MLAKRFGAIAIALVLLAGCSDDGDESTATTEAADLATTSTAPETTTTAPLSDEEAVLAAVDGYWRTIDEAGSDPPDPDHPGFAQYFTGEARQTSVGLIADWKALGLIGQLPENSLSSHDPVVESIAEERAVVVDCAVDDGIILDMHTGTPVNDEVGTYLWRLVLVIEDDSWKVSESAIEEEWEGVSGCATS